MVFEEEIDLVTATGILEHTASCLTLSYFPHLLFQVPTCSFFVVVACSQWFSFNFLLARHSPLKFISLLKSSLFSSFQTKRKLVSESISSLLLGEISVRSLISFLLPQVVRASGNPCAQNQKTRLWAVACRWPGDSPSLNSSFHTNDLENSKQTSSRATSSCDHQSSQGSYGVLEFS